LELPVIRKIPVTQSSLLRKLRSGLPVLCEVSHPRRTLRGRRFPASCGPHVAPLRLRRLHTSQMSLRHTACSLSPSPLISLLSSTERGMLHDRHTCRSGGPTTNPHADTLGSRPSHCRYAAAASRRALRAARFAASASRCPSSPPIFGSCLHVHSPLRASDSALCSSARCLPAKPT